MAIPLIQRLLVDRPDLRVAKGEEILHQGTTDEPAGPGDQHDTALSHPASFHPFAGHAWHERLEFVRNRSRSARERPVRWAQVADAKWVSTALRSACNSL